MSQPLFCVKRNISSFCRSSRDYGTLSCWATNEVGTQADPCRFTVVEAGKHDEAL